jgi:hypothetical protein
MSGQPVQFVSDAECLNGGEGKSGKRGKTQNGYARGPLFRVLFLRETPRMNAANDFLNFGSSGLINSVEEY